MTEARAISDVVNIALPPADVAAGWARMGFPVFPCGPDKRPLTPHGFRDATADLDRVAAMWRAHPAALVGLPTGDASGLFVVDLDTDKTTGEALGETTLAGLGFPDLWRTVPSVRTPSGGWHLYFSSPGLGSTVKRLGAGIDTRGNGGYVIAAGSVGPAGAYVAQGGPMRRETLRALPAPLLDALRGNSAPSSALRIDTGDRIEARETTQAEVEEILSYIPASCGYADWLAVLMGLHDHFSGSPEGLALADQWSATGGDKYKPGEVAAKWRGFTLGGGTGWQSVCALARQNGADLSDIARRHKGRHLPAPITATPATEAGERPARGESRMTLPEPVPFTPQSAPKAFTAWQVKDPATIPRIRFVYGDSYAAGYMAVTFAAPKTGKSLLGMAEAIDAATGRGFLTGEKSAPQSVLYFNAEDDQAVLDARTMAVLQAHDIPQEEIAGRFFPVSGITEGQQLVLIRGEKAEINESAFAFLTEFFQRDGITLAIFDPLQDLSQSPETNEVFRALGARIRRLATETGVAIGIVHHTRKPSAGAQATLDDGRGGSALRGVARFNRLLVPMTESEGAQAGADDFRLFFRIAEAESNLAPPSSDRNRWFQKVGVQIGNGGTYPTIRPWVWPEAFTGVTVNDACRVRALIADRADNDGPPRESVQAQDWAGLIVAEVLGLDTSKKADKARIGRMLKTWIETGVLKVERLTYGAKKKEANFIFPGPNNPADLEI